MVCWREPRDIEGLGADVAHRVGTLQDYTTIAESGGMFMNGQEDCRLGPNMHSIDSMGESRDFGDSGSGGMFD